MARVLVIEDEPALLAILEYNLQQAGHEVLLAPSGEDGLRLAKERPDIILLDMMLPDVQGAEVCRTLQVTSETRGVPILIVSARGGEKDRIAGLLLGAIDYVVKPFSMRELMLRISAVLRRVKRPPPRPRMIDFGRLRIDNEAHRVWVDSVEVELTLIELKLLVALYESRERVQTRAGLMAAIQGGDVSTASRTIDVHVTRLREKLGPASEYIQTVRGIGYRFVYRPDVTDSCPD